MPRRVHGVGQLSPPRFLHLAEELANELKNAHESGQPVIDERTFSTGLTSVRVLWDKWDHVPHEVRSETIVQAYELAEGKEARDRIALATGLTVPEAYASGLLPYQIIPALRRGDPVTPQQCSQAMVEEGATVLLDRDVPRLFFSTEQEAEEGRKRLIKKLPGSEPVWIITRDVRNGGTGDE